MNRRIFISQSGAVAASSLLGRSLLGQPARADGCGGPPSGVQLYTVRDALDRDLGQALLQLRDIGIVEGELYGLNGAANATLFGMPAADVKRAFDANGIRLPATHIGGDLTNHGEIADSARALGVEAVIVALPSEFAGQVDGRFAMVPAKSRAQLDALAEKLNRAGREYRSRGLAFGYHNHHIEFMPVDGVVPYDYLMSNTDASLVKIELDIGWLATAGIDPVAYLRRHAGRVISCHLKDYNASIVSDVPQRKVVAPGAGTVDFAAVLAAMDATGVAHGYIEVDVSDDPFGDVRRGHAHLQRLKGCA
jgi:sugar phosphate isomerase/epimerase